MKVTYSRWLNNSGRPMAIPDDFTMTSISNSTSPLDLRTVLACQMLLIHTMRKRRLRRLMTTPRLLHQTRNLLLLRRAQAREFRQHIFFTFLNTLIDTSNLERSDDRSTTPSDSSISESLDSEPSRLFQNEMSNEEWLDKFRVSQDMFNYLVSELKPFLSLDDEATGDEDQWEISPEKCVAMALWRLGKIKDDPSLLKFFDVTKDTVSKAVKDFCEAIVKVLMPHYVQVPVEDELLKMIRKFRRSTGIYQCAGALNFMHIPILPPPEDAGDYTNSEGWNSIIVQAVVSADYKFWDLNIGWPGSTDIDKVLCNSSLWKKGQENSLFTPHLKKIVGTNIPVLLVAGPNYPLGQWIITPYSTDGTTEEERKFNCILYSALNVSETAFHRLKARFPFLLRHNGSGIDVMPSIIAACSTLHNICESRNEEFMDSWLVEAIRQAFPEPSPKELKDVAVDKRGEKIRNALLNAIVV